MKFGDSSVHSRYWRKICFFFIVVTEGCHIIKNQFSERWKGGLFPCWSDFLVHIRSSTNVREYLIQFTRYTNFFSCLRSNFFRLTSILHIGFHVRVFDIKLMAFLRHFFQVPLFRNIYIAHVLLSTDAQETIVVKWDIRFKIVGVEVLYWYGGTSYFPFSFFCLPWIFHRLRKYFHCWFSVNKELANVLMASYILLGCCSKSMFFSW